MAPTELLAEQHYATLLALAEDVPVALRPRVELVAASLKPKVRSKCVLSCKLQLLERRCERLAAYPWSGALRRLA